MKRVIDLVLSVLVLALLSPLILIVTLCVRLTSPGPALFRQARLGLHGKPFWLLKFRTMYRDSPDLRNPDGSAFSAAKDSRVTPVGGFLRATSLDELPQLINVMRGEMSLVGPRPDQVDQIQYYTETEKRKLLVKPGITGLAQISGRNAISWSERKALEVEYVDRHSVALDLKILLLTIPCVFRARGIHTS
jgi:undecaprenyl phosphate N,N'-diacetylbacillosamine 1-phosphate transferase